mmetsp:Transcript_4564/g.5125  ORF Transcript_4564/g.5125 Transcript_4564/m.5125 type:complete len:147 (+) Transcript_4564:39-479(+)
MNTNKKLKMSENNDKAEDGATNDVDDNNNNDDKIVEFLHSDLQQFHKVLQQKSAIYRSKCIADGTITNRLLATNEQQVGGKAELSLEAAANPLLKELYRIGIITEELERINSEHKTRVERERNDNNNNKQPQIELKKKHRKCSLLP